MKLLANVFIIIFMMFGLSCTAGDGMPGYQKELQKERNLYKDAGVVKEIRFLSESDKLDESAIIIRVRYYDAEGRLTLDSNMAEEGEFGYKYEKYTYDSKGYLTKMELHGYDMVPLVQTYKYDEFGKLVESNFASAEARKYEYFYNDDGYMTEQIGYAFGFEDGSDEPVPYPAERKTFEYNDDNEQVKVVHWRASSDDESGWAIDFEENYVHKDGKIVESSAYHHVYKQHNAAVFYYNDKGLMSKTTPKQHDGKLIEEYSQYFMYEYK